LALASGDRLGSYEILSPIGAGGMGEVSIPDHHHGRQHGAISSPDRRSAELAVAAADNTIEIREVRLCHDRD
jgi:hypothetical protein